MARDTGIKKKKSGQNTVDLPPMVQAPAPPPPGAVKPNKASSPPPPLPPLTEPLDLVTESSSNDDAVTRRVWLNHGLQEALHGQKVGSQMPQPPRAKKQTIYPPPAGPGAVKPPTVAAPAASAAAPFDVDDEAVTQELKLDQLVSITRHNIGWNKRSSHPPNAAQEAQRIRQASTIPPPNREATEIVSERPTFLSGLALANRRQRLGVGEKKKSSSIIPAIQLSIKSIVARLLKNDEQYFGAGGKGEGKRSVFSLFRSPLDGYGEEGDGEEILKGISPKLLRAAAQDKVDDNIAKSDDEWRDRVEAGTSNEMQSFLKTPFVRQTGSDMHPHIVQQNWPQSQMNNRRTKSAYKISMGGPIDKRNDHGGVNSGDTSDGEQGRFSMMIAEPPKIHLKGALLKRRGREMILLRGRAEHPVRVKDIMVFADKQKILYLSSASRQDAGYIEFSADVPLENHTNHILVVARHDDDVMGSQSLFVRRDRSHQIDPQAATALRIAK